MSGMVEITDILAAPNASMATNVNPMLVLVMLVQSQLEWRMPNSAFREVTLITQTHRDMSRWVSRRQGRD
jgi:hypothetical protein